MVAFAGCTGLHYSLSHNVGSMQFDILYLPLLLNERHICLHINHCLFGPNLEWHSFEIKFPHQIYNKECFTFTHFGILLSKVEMHNIKILSDNWQIVKFSTLLICKM